MSDITCAHYPLLEVHFYGEISFQGRKQIRQGEGGVHKTNLDKNVHALRARKVNTWMDIPLQLPIALIYG